MRALSILIAVGCTGGQTSADDVSTDTTETGSPTDEATDTPEPTADTGTTPVDDPLAPPDDGWAWQNPLPHGHPFNDVWVDSEDYALAVGNGQVLYRWQDDAWARIGLPVKNERKFGRSPGFTPDYWSVHGWSSSQIKIGALYGPVTWDGALDVDIWSATLIDDPTPQYLWGTAPDALWALGGQGSWFYDGKWSAAPQPFMSGYQGIWGTSANDVFTVGWLGRMNHFDGSKWEQFLTGELDDVLGVWTAGPDATVWVAGEAGTIFGFDRTAGSFTPVATGVEASFRDVWGASASDVWAVGDEGTIFHYDGKTWAPQASGTDQALFAAYGSSATDVWAVGDHGVIVHYDGTTWGPIDAVAGTYDDLVDISLSSGTHGWAVGGESALLQYDGNTWTPTTAPLSEPRSVWAASATDGWMVNERDIARFDGAGWTIDAFPVLVRFRQVSGGGGRVVVAGRHLWERVGGKWVQQVDATGGIGEFRTLHVNPDGQVFAAGNHDVAHSPAAGTWVAIPFPWYGDAPVLAVWGSSGTDIYVGGQYGLYHYDGTQWVRITDAVPNGPNTVSAIWGTSSDDVWVASYVQGVWHWDGTSWSQPLTWTFTPMSAVQGVEGEGLWVVGTGGMIIFRDDAY